MFPARLVRLKVDDPGIIFFNFFQPFSGINFCMDFVDFWVPFGLNFRRFFCYLSILFRYFSACRFCIEFCMVLRWIFASFLMTFSTTCSTNLRTRRFCKMYVFPKENHWFSRFDGFIFQRFFDVFSIPFRHWFLYGFSKISGAILGAFCIPFRPLWHHFWILFSVLTFAWFPDAALAPKTKNPGPVLGSLFRTKIMFFPGLVSGLEFSRILMKFGWNLDEL